MATTPSNRVAQLGAAGHGLLEERFFYVGVGWLLLAAGLIAFVIFGQPLCSQLQIKTFGVVVSLAAGFLAWTFAGSISAESRSLIPGIAIVAVGGFAVFLTLLFHFGQDNLKTIDPRCAPNTGTRSQAVTSLYEELAVHTSNVVKELTEAKYNSGLNRQVFELALPLRTKISHFPNAELDDFRRAILDLYSAQTAISLTLSLDPVAANARDGKLFAREAAVAAGQSTERLLKVMRGGDALAISATEHAARYKSLEKAKYLGGLARIADLRWSQLGGEKPEATESEIAAQFTGLSSQFLREISAASDGPMKWFCESRGKETPPCTML